MSTRSFLAISPQRLHRALPRLQSWHLGCSARRTCTPFRYASVLTPPAPPAAPSAPPPHEHPPTHLRVESTQELLHGSFTHAFQRAVDDVARPGSVIGLQRQHASSTSSSSPQLSPWLQYLVGLRADPPLPNRSGDDAPLGGSRRPSSDLSSRFSADASGADGVFLHHVFGNAKEATLYVSVRQPREFLRPEAAAEHPHAHLRLTDDPAKEWALLPFGSVLSRLDAVLREMARRQLAARPQDAAWTEGFLLPFWRAMLEQAFLTQYCEVDALAITASPATQTGDSHARAVYDVYLYDYREQPAELRRRLEQGIRSLLCASAFTLHAQWEQYMMNHGPSNRVAHVLGLELVLLWWYANPDQVPVELTSSIHRLPPCTLRQQQRLAEAGRSDGTPGRSTMQRATMATHSVTSVEHHLRAYICTHISSDVTAQENLKDNTRVAAGGFLCPAAVFPPSYQDALRAHLRQVHRRNFITCPLFVRVLEVAIAVGSTSPRSWEDAPTTATMTRASDQKKAADGASALERQRRTTQTAANRGREIARCFIVDWLWPVVCSAHESDGSAPSSTPSVHELLHPAAPNANAAPSSSHHNSSLDVSADSTAEKREDWAVLVAVVSAVAHLRGHLLALRHGSRVKRRASGAASDATTDGRNAKGRRSNAEGIAYVRDQRYTPAMRVLLCAPVQHEVPAGSFGEGSVIHSNADLPSWVHLVFAHALFCFQDCGWLRHNAAHQPATPARLWGQLFHTFCDVFPNVFHAGSTATVLLALWAIEGAASAPSTYYSAFQPLSKGRVEAMQAWTGVLARTQRSRPLVGKSDRKANALLWTDEKGEALADNWAVPEDSLLCPRAERCERAAYIAAAASAGEPARSQQAVSPSVASEEDAVPHNSRQPTPRGRRLRDAQPLLPSFASPCPFPPPPSHVSSVEARTQMQNYLDLCKELREEVADVLLHIFRSYATLPILRSAASDAGDGLESRTHGGGTTISPPSSEEVIRLRSMGQPSLFVLLKLLHSLAVFGGAFSSGRPRRAQKETTVAELVPCVLRDVVAACHPIVASYLRRMQVYSATMSGKDGALALLFDGDFQTQLNSLPPQLGRRRLVAALLWSGLPASALTDDSGDAEKEEKEDTDAGGCANDAAFGSGSLAWHVLGSNQRPFFSTLPTAASPSASNGVPPRQSSDDAGESTAPAEPLSTNRPKDVVDIAEEVVKHLWQLAIVVSEPARVVLDLRRYLCACASTVTKEVVHGVEQDEAATEEESTQRRTHDGDANKMADDYADHTIAFDELASEIAVVSGEEETTAATPSSSWREAAVNDDEDSDAPTSWAREATVEMDAAAADSAQFFMSEALPTSEMLESTAEDEGRSTRWNSHDTIRLSAGTPPTATEAAEQAQREDIHQQRWTEAAEAQASCRVAIVAALQPTLPSSQHLFFSLLELLAWVANAQHSGNTLATLAELKDGASKTFTMDQVGSAAWCGQLATYYNLCAMEWAAQARVRHGDEGNRRSPDSASADKAAVLCRPTLMVQVILVLSQTCPDVYVLSLLLLNLILHGTDGRVTSAASQTSLTRRWQRAISLFPWSVECALAQLLYHAGVNSATVLRWRGLPVRATETDTCERDVDAILVQVTTHHALLESFSAGVKPEDGRHRREATAQDLLMSIGSLLLSSLHLRFRCSAGTRPFHRYNVYMSEFLMYTFAGPSETRKGEISTLRAVLPSVQVTSYCPSSEPPQQLVPLRQAWRERVSVRQREVLRRCFRDTRTASAEARRRGDFRAPQRSATVSTTHRVASKASEDDYVDAFL
ncbi:hypothetical protein ABB37_07552 [Leptomonas pyrrhocoris]|uniref:Uncharacterized protein n=1 Tax=Leptomonas pyrrhocoris TaxID=157538 RepID=A0A0M9FVB8_LEPPY|nr:hypothetical protein ABB37_07552 [Leptomonas pyrrhocoris]XP_015655158.1 hypothetical protein ABB37_07552 [Leptomonas pyrrhocoris]KPA76718.1 hypothetical protein ABB37_07552 [Leptomonas pyrrhocoris]KPA76719.1 hypothetical protein ABB37_07552 [Leptomonas pyrrhocoris]|eukprot:XP_015655157.1 hypothetical protein ABB37_07552 [Leptomonas pyrrhocoris]